MAVNETNRCAVLMVGFGGPERSADVRPFVEKVVAGRGVSAERVNLVVEQYAAIGGVSPYNKLMWKQAAALQSALRQQGLAAEIFAGFLYSSPTIEDTIKAIAQKGFKQVAGIIMAPHRTEASFERYLNSVRAAVQQSSGLPMVDFIGGWHQEPLFIEAIADRVQEQLQRLNESEMDATRIIFTAHSVPKEMSDQSRYAQQIAQTATMVFEVLQDRGSVTNIDYVVAYQSRSGSPQQEWLEPDISAAIENSKDEGKKNVVVVPIGFLVDHVEVLYDLDVLAMAKAGRLGVRMLRSTTVGDHCKFIQMLASKAQEKIQSFHAELQRH